MNLFQLASRGVDLDALPDDEPPRALIDFGPAPVSGGRSAMPAQYNDLFDAAAAEYDLPPDILKGLGWAESRFRPDVIDGTTRSSAGAIGMMQHMPGTAKELGINPTDPVESVFGAAAYLRQNLDKFGGDMEKAIAAYNWGPNRKAYDRDDWYKSLPAETRNYVGTVLEFADGVAPARTGKALPLPEGVAPSQAGGGRGVVNPEQGVNHYQEPAKALKRDEFAPLDEATRGVKTGITGLKQMWESNAVLKDATLAANMQERLDAFDRIDQGATNVPRAIGLAYQQAGPEERQRLRGVVQKELGNRREFLDASLATIKQYQADMQRTKGRVTDFTDIEGVKDFTNWLAFNGGSGMASMAPLIVAAVTTGPLAPLAAGAVGYGMATGELNSDRIEYAQKQGLDNKGVADYVADKRGSTIGAAIPFAGLDVVAGPAGSVVKTMTKGGVKGLQRMGLKQAGKDVAKDTAEEAVTGGLQEMIKLGTGYGLDETQELLTKENAKKVLNSAAAEAAGGLTGGAARVAGTAAVQQMRTPRVEDQPTTPQAPVVPAAPETAPQVPVAEPAQAGAQPAPAGSSWSEVTAAQKQAQAEQAVMAKAEALPTATRRSDAASTQAVSNIEALLGPAAQPAAAPAATAAPATEQAAATVEQAEQQLAARESAQAQPAAPVDMQMRTTGTLMVKGDPVALRARLTPAGVDNTIAVPGGLIVARSQATKAQEVLSAPAQAPAAPTAAVIPQQEAANVQQGQTPPAQPAAQAASTTAPAVAAVDAGVPATGVPTAGGAAPAQADGVTGQKIDGEWTAFAPESGTRAVPRAEMPQIKAEHRGAMVNFLKARGVDAAQQEVPAASLKPTQAEFSPAKVAQAKAYTGGDRSILVSSDGHVLDGHHQWLAKREAGEPVKVIRLDAPIADLLPLVKEFPSSTQAEGARAPQESTNVDPTPPGVRLADEQPSSAAPAAPTGQSESAGRPADAQPDARGPAGRGGPAEAVAGVQPAVPAGSGGAAADPIANTEGGTRQYSRGISPEIGAELESIKPPRRVKEVFATKDSVNAALAQLVPASGRLPNGLGRIVVANADEIKPNWEPLIGPVEVASESAGRAQGFYDQRTRTVFLIADHIRAGDELAVAAHELMHKHGEAVLGADGWNKLHSTIERWANAREGSTERLVYDEAVARVEASRPGDISIPEYTTQELFPYAVQIALEMGIQPSATKPLGTVAGWLAHVRGVLSRTWAKMTGKPDLFDSLDLVDMAFAIAQRENPDAATSLDGAAEGQGSAVEPSALEEFSKADDLFALPKSNKTTIEGIAAEHEAGIQVRKTSFPGNETMYTLNMPNGGGTARITVRASTDSSVYGAEDLGEGGYSWETGRPGENPDDVPAGTEDVWIDVSNLQPGKRGDMVYNIAATFAHNTGRIFIGDPSGLSAIALRRRLEHMISSALKFGTTEHLAPHPNQVRGGNGVPPLRWVYGDHEGNVERMIAASVQALDNAYPDSQNIAYDPARGFYRTDTGDTLARGQLADGLQQSIRGRREETGGAASTGQAGWRTVARAALFRFFQGSRDGAGGDGRGLLDRAREDVTRLQRRGTADGTGSAYPEQERIFYSRDGAVTPEKKEPALQWRDASGRVQFAPGEWLYNKLGAAAAPMLTALGLKSASPELRRQLRQMKLQVQRAQELSAKVATEAAKLSAEDRAMVSDLVEKDMQAGTVPPEHAVKLAALISATMDKQSAELVELGMLSKEGAERWQGTYLPRFYESKLSKKVGDAWADAMRRLVGRPRLMKGIGGKHLKGRGMFETIDPASLENYQALGWEVRDPDYVPGTSTEVQVWRDFNREERAKMGEIRDAGFRFVMGYMQTQKDIALGRMFQNLANDERFSSRLPTKEMSVRVPDTKVEGTGAHTYGKLAGRYVSKETLSHLSSFDEVHNDTLQMYRQAMSLWKEGKTVLNPVAHMNNVVSNLTMAHLAGISYHRGDKYIGALADFIKGSPMIEDAKDAGLFLGNFSESELMQQMPEDLKKLVNLQEGLGAKSTKTAMAVMTWALRKPLGKAYEFEDSFFKYLLYKDARQRGLEQQDAIDFAQRYIFTYDDLPKGARRIRDFGIPFFAYTYKAVPALLHTAMAHPVRMATPAALLWATTALTYAAMADGDDDTPWEELVKKYLTDADFRKKAGEAREFDQKHMPTWMRGSTAFFTPKTMRVGYDKVMDLPVFLDISRFIPGGDLFDVTPNAGGLPLPQPVTPNHPLLTMAMGLLGNKDLFSGKELADKNDTKGEAAEKRLLWIYRQVAPAVAIGQYHWNRGMDMVAQASGGEITWMPDVVSEKYTGIGNDGLPVLPEYGIPQTFGIKIRPMDQDKAAAIERAIDKKLIQSIDADIRQLARQNRNGTLSDKAFEKQRDYQREKRDRLREGLTVDGNERE